MSFASILLSVGTIILLHSFSSFFEFFFMKILLVIPTLDSSGAEKQFSLLATRLPRNEFDVQAVALTRGGPYEEMFEEQNVPLTILNKRFKFDPIVMYRLRKIIQDWQPDIVHSWMFTASSYTRLVTGNKTTPKVIVSERCVDSWKSGWQLKLDSKQIDRTTLLVGNSKPVVEFYENLGYPADITRVIHNGIDIPDVSTQHQQRDQILAEFDLPKGANIIGFVGRLAPQKRVRDLIWAMQLMRQLRKKTYFLIVGDGEQRHMLEESARHFGCDPYCRFVGHRNDASSLIPLMNVFWLASDFEGLSNSLMEAMAAGVPAVVSDIPPNRELVIDGETGFFVNPGDSVGFAQFADRILADDALAKRLGDASIARMKDHFSIKQMIDNHAKMYREVVD